MDIIKRIKLEYPIIESSIRDNISSGSVVGILEGFGESIKDDDYDGMGYYLKELNQWYENNIESIISSDFVSNKSDHKRNYAVVDELREQYEKEQPINYSFRIKKGSILHTAFDEYRIIKIIGQGGNGKVYEAVNLSGLHVAIKVVNVAVLTKEKRKRFKNEINFCQTKQHKNIIEVIDYGSDSNGQYAFYVMPLYKDTLRDRIKHGIQPADAVEIFYSIMTGMEYAHSLEVYHRDIKPENILFADDSTRNL